VLTVLRVARCSLTDMQISSNTTGMEAGICVSTDKEGYDYCVVVVKGTFSIEKEGDLILSKKQMPLIYADEHYGDPGSTAIKYECDFSPFKPRTDILVNGYAYSETGNPVTETTVGLMVGSIKKIVKVFGDRVWEDSLTGYHPSQPKPFVKMPLTFDRAFGGSDYSHQNQKKHGAELRNLVGKGYYKNSDFDNVEKSPLPNLENPNELIKRWSDKPDPMGFGALGRGWQPKINYAGTYDKKWLDERFPFLPIDFDEQYFLSAPEDQQLSSLEGGEAIRCFNMTADRVLTVMVPKIEIPVTYHFRDRTENVVPILDTLLIEPDENRVMLTWRCRVKLGRKLNALREIKIGRIPIVPQKRNGKQYFKSIAELVIWKKENKVG